MTTADYSQSRQQALIARARHGDVPALGELLAQYRAYLVFLARSQLHHNLQAKADPSDMAQEVCLAAQDGIGEFQGGSPEEFAAWLRGILGKVIAMHVRRYLGTHKRDPRLELGLDQRLADASGFLQSGLAGDATSPSQHALRQEACLQLADALEALPADYRQVIMLRHLEGLPFADVARHMGRSIDSVEKLWVRALSKLRSQLN